MFLAQWHFLINPCIAAILPWTPLPPHFPHQKEIHISVLPIQTRSWIQKLPLLLCPSPTEGGGIPPSAGWEGEPQAALQGLTSSVQKEQSLSTRMHSVQLFARDSTQRLSARKDQGIRDGENKVSCGRV